MRILMFSDSPDFGGHERCTADLAHAFQSQAEVSAVQLMAAHPRLREEAHAYGIEVQESSPAPQPWAGLLAYAPAQLAALRAKFSGWRPDCIFLSQGNIEFGIRALLTARRLELPVWSYIPICQSLAQQEARWGSLRDRLAQRHYKYIDGFVVNSSLQERYLRQWIGAEIPVVLLENYIDAARYPCLAPRVPGSLINLACIGRIRFKQKGQDRLISLAQSLKETIGDGFRISIIGDGPDRAELERLISAANLSSFFVFTGWLSDIRTALVDVDLVLSCSHFEGVPLIMTETLLCGRPFFAPAWPGIDEYLSSEFIYQNLDEAPAKILAYLKRPLEERQAKLDAYRAVCAERHGPIAYQKGVGRILSLMRSSLPSTARKD